MQIRAVTFSGLMFTVLLLMGHSLFAQNIEFKKKNFPGRADEFKLALASFEKGMQLMKSKPIDYQEAKNYLSAAADFNPKNLQLCLNLAICHYYSHNYDASIKSCLQFDQINGGFDPEIDRIRAKSLLHLHQFAKAIELIDSCIFYYQSEKNKVEVQRMELWKSNAIEAEKELGKSQRIFIDPLGMNINSKGNESHFIYDDESQVIYFISNNKDNKLRSEGLVYSSQKIQDTIWTDPIELNFDFDLSNTQLLGISPNGNLLISQGKRSDIYEFRLIDNLWVEEQKLDKSISAGNVKSLCYTASEDTMFFSSKLKGGLGGYDIYYSVKQANKWSKPHNLGEPINSDKDEVYVGIFNNQLVFSSNRNPSFGGYDIYRSEININRFPAVEHLSYPINTTHHEYGLYQYFSGEKAILISDRPGSVGYADLFAVQFMGPPKDPVYLVHPSHAFYDPIQSVEKEDVGHKMPIKEKQYFLWNAAVVDSLKLNGLSCKMSIYDLESNQRIFSDSIKQKYFDLILPFGKVYSVQFDHKQFLPHSRIIDLRKEYQFIDRRKNVGLLPIKRNHSDFLYQNLSVWTKDNLSYLDPLVLMINENPYRQIELVFRVLNEDLIIGSPDQFNLMLNIHFENATTKNNYKILVERISDPLKQGVLVKVVK